MDRLGKSFNHITISLDNISIYYDHSRKEWGVNFNDEASGQKYFWKEDFDGIVNLINQTLDSAKSPMCHCGEPATFSVIVNEDDLSGTVYICDDHLLQEIENQPCVIQRLEPGDIVQEIIPEKDILCMIDGCEAKAMFCVHTSYVHARESETYSNHVYICYGHLTTAVYKSAKDSEITIETLQ